jgi:hypothetical protein
MLRLKPLLLLFAALTFAIASCEQEIEPTPSDHYTVVYLPSQCAPQHSGVLGLKSPTGTYYLVLEGVDLEKDYVSGDRVKVDLSEQTTGWAVCLACHCPAPDKAAIVHSISKL